MSMLVTHTPAGVRTPINHHLGKPANSMNFRKSKYLSLDLQILSTWAVF
jgi:hypothetical protein